jgi:hypothetical protein
MMLQANNGKNAYSHSVPAIKNECVKADKADMPDSFRLGPDLLLF